ncbi:hypothetical protein F5Y16DRAFT_367838 [Xylariaceae sp. FL0255]|nr:hypothetical protein F5Y16DRAFT_367838 [Xylariaceae sp. FL0255]
MKITGIKLFGRGKRDKKDKKDKKPDLEREKYHLYNPRHTQYTPFDPTNHIFAPWLELPAPILERVFAFVCPHSKDESYDTCEQSPIGDACTLCDLRDLSHAGQVCRAWRKVQVEVMYHSIRIDTVHYCDLEIELSERRRRKTNRFDKNGIPEDVASARLHLLCRTLRDDPVRLGKRVQFFKTPYMLRESSTSVLARTIAVLPNLRYVDLPEGLFVDDPAYQTLKFEVQARCPDLRKMTYMAGAERSLEHLTSGQVWTNLEVLELGKVDMDPQVLRQVLAVLQNLRAFKASDCRMLDNDIFRYNDVMPAFPPVEELILREIPRVTADGLVAYLAREDARNNLKVLSLTNTGVHPTALHNVLAHAPRLATLSITEQIDSPFPSHVTPAIPPLTSWSLETLRFEITASPAIPSYASTTAGYHNYLASSLFAGGLPRLAAIYVRDQNFPDMLLGLPPPMPGFAGSPQRPSSAGTNSSFGMGTGKLSPNSTGGYSNPPRFSSNNPFSFASSTAGSPRGPAMLSLNQTLEIFTKEDDDMDWGSTRMDPFSAGNGRGGQHGRSGSTASGRPLSSYGLSGLGEGWQGSGGARMSIMQGDGNGGFLTVPGDNGPAHLRKGSGTSSNQGRDEWPRPISSHGPKSRDRDLWR